MFALLAMLGRLLKLFKPTFLLVPILQARVVLTTSLRNNHFQPTLNTSDSVNKIVVFVFQEAQLNEVLAASNLDPTALTVVTRKLEVTNSLFHLINNSSFDFISISCYNSIINSPISLVLS